MTFRKSTAEQQDAKHTDAEVQQDEPVPNSWPKTRRNKPYWYLLQCKKLLKKNKMKKRGLEPSAAAYTALFNACAQSPWKPSALEQALKLQQELRRKNIPLNAITHHALLKTLARAGELRACFQVLRVWHRMLSAGIKPDVQNYNLLLRAARDCGMGDPALASTLLLRKWEQPQFTAQRSALSAGTCETQPLDMDAFERSVLSDTASDLTLSTKHFTQTQPSPVSTSSSVPNLLDLNTCHSDVVALAMVSTASDRLALIGDLHGFLSKMSSDGLKPSIKTLTLLADVTEPSSQSLRSLIDVANQSGVKLDAGFFNTLIRRAAKAGDVTGAQTAKSLMLERKLKLNSQTFCALALACRTPKDGLQLFTDMQACGVAANAYVFSALIGQATRHLDYDWLRELLHHMHRLQVSPNEVIIQQLEFAAQFPPNYDQSVVFFKADIRELTVFKCLHVAEANRLMESKLEVIVVSDDEDAVGDHTGALDNSSVLIVEDSQQSEDIPFFLPALCLSFTDSEISEPESCNVAYCEQCFCYICDHLASQKYAAFLTELENKNHYVSCVCPCHSTNRRAAESSSANGSVAGCSSYTSVMENIQTFLDDSIKENPKTAAVRVLGAIKLFITHSTPGTFHALAISPVLLELVWRALSMLQVLFVEADFPTSFIKQLQDFFHILPLPYDFRKYRNSLNVLPWDDPLLSAVLKGQNVSGVRQVKGRRTETLEESLVVVRTRVLKLQQQNRYRELARYLKVVKSDNVAKLQMMRDWVPLYLCKVGDYDRAVDSLFSAMFGSSCPASRLNPAQFGGYLKIFRYGQAPTGIPHPPQVEFGPYSPNVQTDPLLSSTWAPIEDGGGANAESWIKLLKFANQSSSSSSSSSSAGPHAPCFPEPDYSFLIRIRDISMGILTDLHHTSRIQIPKGFQSGYPEQAMLLLATQALAERLLHSRLKPILTVILTFKSNPWVMRWLFSSLLVQPPTLQDLFWVIVEELADAQCRSVLRLQDAAEQFFMANFLCLFFLEPNVLLHLNSHPISALLAKWNEFENPWQYHLRRLLEANVRNFLIDNCLNCTACAYKMAAVCILL
ncbi:Pentatricopeptide repeat-containing protein 1, mitochondrial [Bagarius yarrelli]|uniref:Pentatricopeptide repeat-containing protein 1, mitochondrial n=1 Tax=Bagarius yarrelli TaxID=175774 RepID=A0A556VAT5_BAGYA|nr:Pentatricopeptide repeat-containing protein 1, mitochondrial [Bagarius yarrelli]